METKHKVGLWISALCALCQGCYPVSNLAQTLVIEPAEYCVSLNDVKDKRHCRELADKSWTQFRASSPDTAFSSSFEQGFKYAFADYLYAGGAGNPPPVPPRCYWNAKYEGPQGHQLIEDWYAGFRQGAASAQISGYRQSILVPASTALPRRMLPASNAPPTPREGLPSPRELPPPGAQFIQPNRDLPRIVFQDTGREKPSWNASARPILSGPSSGTEIFWNAPQRPILNGPSSMAESTMVEVLWSPPPQNILSAPAAMSESGSAEMLWNPSSHILSAPAPIAEPAVKTGRN